MNDFFKKLLQEIHTARVNLESNITSQQPQYSETIEKISSNFPFLNDKIDLDQYPHEDYWEEIKKILNTQTSFWNNSLRQLLQSYCDIYEDNGSQSENPTIDSNEYSEVEGKIQDFYQMGEKLYSYNTNDIQNADAGFSFNEIPWVKPWYNRDEYEEEGKQQSYLFVRGNDLNSSAIHDFENLQFTREWQENLLKQIRLIMPKNTRRVEVEDLNRNFWVISQVIAAVSIHLFGDKSPYKSLFSKILNEVIQLWENILYQWVQTLLYLTPPVESIFQDLFPISNKKNQPYNKFDNFEIIQEEDLENEELILNIVKENTEDLAYKYTNSHLVLLPYFRLNNYQKNYFQKMVLPYVCLYNTEKKEWTYHKIEDEDGNFFSIEPVNFADKLYGAREDDYFYHYLYPLSYGLNYKEKNGPFRYYGALRPKLEAEVTLEEGVLHLRNIKLKVLDGIKNILNISEDLVILYKANTYISENTAGVALEVEWEKIAPEIEEYIAPTQVKQHEAYYLGEMPSCCQDDLPKDRYSVIDNTIIGNAYIMRVANFFPSGLPAELDGSQLEVIANGQAIMPPSTGWTYERSSGAVPTEYIWNLAYSPYGGLTDDVILYQPFYKNGEIHVRNAGRRDEITYQDMRLIATDSIADFIINNRHLSDSNVFKIQTFSNGYQDDQAGISYFFALIGIGINQGTTGYGNPVSFISYAFRYIPYRLKNLVDTDLTMPLREEIEGEMETIGYLQYLGKINKTTSLIAYGDWITSGLHFQEIIGEQEVANYIAVSINDLATGFINFYDLPPAVQRHYRDAVDKNAIITNYLDSLSQDSIDELIKNEDEIKNIIAAPTIYWNDYSSTLNADGNIDYYKNSQARQIVKLQLKSVIDEQDGVGFTFYPASMYCRKESSNFNLITQKKLYSITNQPGYTYGGLNENDEYYLWTGDQSVSPGLTYEQVLNSTYSLEDDQHYNTNWEPTNPII